MELLAAKIAQYINVNLIKKKFEGRLLQGDRSGRVQHYATETWMNGGLGVAPRILKLRTRRRHVPSLTLRPLHPCILFKGDSVSPRASLASMARHKISSLSHTVRARDVRSLALSLRCMSYSLSSTLLTPLILRKQL